ncbi:MAG: hypothetical protein ACOC8B_03155 [Gemmatimonadota bacterium]
MRRCCVPPRDPEALAGAIAAIEGLSRAELAAHGTAGRSFVRERYDVRRLNDRLIHTALASR